jgi:hypothetical protein
MKPAYFKTKGDRFMEVMLDGIYVPSEKIVAREIEGELIIVPLISGIGDMEDELFTFNETGRAIWRKLDGKNSLRQVAHLLQAEFDAPVREIEVDVLGLAQELCKRNMIARVE